MSELQKALLAIGFGVIVLVYVFGWWQQRQYRRKFGAAFKANQADVLYQEQGSMAEPAVQLEQAVLKESIEHMMAGAIPAIDEAEAEAVEAVAAEPPAVAPVLDESCAMLDARRDFIIDLHLSEPSPAAVLDGLWQRKFDFGKPVQVCGLTLAGGQWERAIAESQTLYRRFRIALQLVDRSGAISLAKLAEFRDLVQGVARQTKADAAIPDTNEIYRYAAGLDALCAEVDQMVGINLVPPGERLLAGARIAQTASLHGMKLEADGAFHLLNAQGHSLFSLISQDNKPFQHHTLEHIGTAGVTLLLDVPRVENPAVQFDQMVRVAHEMAKELQANMVDDHRVVLSDGGLARIREQIVAVESKMIENNIPPGSAQTRRLFS